ncbi:MAG: hypothetical protein IPM95_10830 [Sphingobacteriales bacterium]|nr:hypothetical protein [Sphingobacteriales bacterium]
MIKGISITIIADGIKNEEDSRLFADTLLKALPNETQYTAAQRYAKFTDTYKLEFTVPTSAHTTRQEQLYRLHLLADRMAAPWLVYFDGAGNNTELIFNRDEHTRAALPEFSSIRWALLQWIY